MPVGIRLKAKLKPSSSYSSSSSPSSSAGTSGHAPMDINNKPTEPPSLMMIMGVLGPIGLRLTLNETKGEGRGEKVGGNSSSENIHIPVPVKKSTPKSELDHLRGALSCMKTGKCWYEYKKRWTSEVRQMRPPRASPPPSPSPSPSPSRPFLEQPTRMSLSQ